MKILFTLLFALSSLSLFAASGNICTVSLFDKATDIYGNDIPGKGLGTAAAIDLSGMSGAYGKLFSVSKKRAVIFKGTMDYDGYFEAKFEEVDQDRDGDINFRNPVNLSESKVFYSSYETIKANNMPAMVILKDYIATISCLSYTVY